MGDKITSIKYRLQLAAAWGGLCASAFAAEMSCDVLVVGGGAAGIAAALQSGRAGASTVLVERGSQVGGNMTTGGVNFPGLFHAGGRQEASEGQTRLVD